MNKYINEGRLANQKEKEACAKAIKSFGLAPDDYTYYLYGRHDAPYGWYLFGLGEAHDEKGEYLILGDCLDVLPDHKRVLQLRDVHKFAFEDMSGAYEAIQEWGLFHSLSMPLKQMMCDICGEESLNETIFWDSFRKEWRLGFEVCYQTEAGAEEEVHTSIPACLSCSKEADEEFAKEWGVYRQGYDLKAEATANSAADDSISFDVAFDRAKAKEQAIAHIGNAINYFIETGKTDYGKPQEQNCPPVWVLTIRSDGQNFPEVHRTLEGAIKGVTSDVKEHMDGEEGYDFEKIAATMRDERYWKDEMSGTVYDIADCRIWD